MLPIDKEENCKRMIETGQYQIPRSRGKEDKWLFAYLKKNGIGRNEAYQIWLPILLLTLLSDASNATVKSIKKTNLIY